MRALREFRYQDFSNRQVVTVKAGAELDSAALARLSANKVDIDKMVRTKYMDVEQVTIPKRRGRPPKAK